MHPSRVGSYLIEKKIGAGGMGTVYYGVHAETEQPAAVKVLPASLAREPGFVARFNREIAAIKQLVNPHVVALFESGVDGDISFYAMEYVDGETLTSRLRREKRLNWKEVIDISMQICSALKAAHDAGIIHRDLKPSNLMIAREGMVKLTDFGVAQVFAGTKLTVTGGIIGTAEYMSPEQAQGQRATKKSDLYSLGAVMYVMLTGRPPFDGKTTLEVIQKHRYGQFSRPCLIVPEIPHWLDEVVCQLLEKDPDKRFADAYVLQRKLQEVLQKVEYSAKAETQVSPREGGTSELFASGAAPGPGAGTLMRDLLRAELDHVHRRTPIGSLLNNTWVLIGLLVLVIAGGIVWYRSRELTAEEKFDRAVAILNEPESSEWRRARDEYLVPLLDNEEDRAVWEPKVEPMLKQIELYEWKSKLGMTGKRQTITRPANEAERLLKRAMSSFDDGDLVRAGREFAALLVLIRDRPEYENIAQAAEAFLEEIRGQTPSQDERLALLQSSLEKAKRLRAEKKWKELHEILSAALELYGSDPEAKQMIEDATQPPLSLSGPDLENTLSSRSASPDTEEPDEQRN